MARVNVTELITRDTPDAPAPEQPAPHGAAPADEVDGSVESDGVLVGLVAADHAVGDGVTGFAELSAEPTRSGYSRGGYTENTSR